jgi:hypothetical protein
LLIALSDGIEKSAAVHAASRIESTAPCGKKIPSLEPLPVPTSKQSKMDRHRREAENRKLFLHID